MTEVDHAELVSAIVRRIRIASDYSNKVNDYSTHVEGCAEEMAEQIVTELLLMKVIS